LAFLVLELMELLELLELLELVELVELVEQPLLEQLVVRLHQLFV
jgi:hypothetical protein